MIEFKCEELYPLLPPDSHSYTDSQAHAESVDAWLGLRTAETEAKIAASGNRYPGQQSWSGLPVQAMLTPYIEIRRMLAQLSSRPGDLIVDLGAGYGRMGFVIGSCHPGVRFLGLELVHERVEEGSRILKQWNVSGAELIQADLEAPDFRMPEAPCYFIYDYGTRTAVERTLEQLRETAARRPIIVVGRGRLTRDCIERSNPWLSQIVPPEHHGNFSIYRTVKTSKPVMSIRD